LASSVFARHYSRNHRLFSLPVGTEMFHFPTFPPPALCVQAGVTGHDSSRVSPFGDPRITVRLPTPRGLSQAPTSFFGSWCQGIHRAPLLTWPQRCSRPLCSSQATVGGRPDPLRTPKPGAVRRRPVPSTRGRPPPTSQWQAPPWEPRGELALTPSGPNSVPKRSPQPARVPLPEGLY
jgi:hypothetical protein